MCTRKQISQPRFLSPLDLILYQTMGWDLHLDLDSPSRGWASELGLDLGEP